MVKVEEIKRKYREEWVLAEVIEEDEFGQPTEVEMIAHSKARDEIYDKQRELNKDIAIIYTGEIPKKGYAVAFNGQI